MRCCRQALAPRLDASPLRMGYASIASLPGLAHSLETVLCSTLLSLNAQPGDEILMIDDVALHERWHALRNEFESEWVGLETGAATQKACAGGRYTPIDIDNQMRLCSFQTARCKGPVASLRENHRI